MSTFSNVETGQIMFGSTSLSIYFIYSLPSCTLGGKTCPCTPPDHPESLSYKPSNPPPSPGDKPHSRDGPPSPSMSGPDYWSNICTSTSVHIADYLLRVKGFYLKHAPWYSLPPARKPASVNGLLHAPHFSIII